MSYFFHQIITHAINKFCCFGFSVAKGPKFRPQNTKGAEKNCMGPGKSGAELLADLSKKGRKEAEKGANFFVVWVCTKTVTFLANTCNLPLVILKTSPLFGIGNL
jgi:hypothetical protein